MSWNFMELKYGTYIENMELIWKLRAENHLYNRLANLENEHEHVRCNPDVAPRLNSDKLMLLPQSTYLPEGCPIFVPY